MAAALAIDVPSTDTSPAMTAVGDSCAKTLSPRSLPAPVTIPPRFDDNHHAAVAKDDLLRPASSSLSPQVSPSSKHPPPLPIPDFVFPARPSSSAPSYPRVNGRRPKSVADLHDRGSMSSHTTAFPGPGRSNNTLALPDFSFNPGAAVEPASTPSHPFLSPPLSPQSARGIPMRPGGGGHRRGGSEFVGGGLRSGEPLSFLSTSPTKSEGGLSPNLAPQSDASLAAPKPSGPPGGRRGHAHRRSAAISIHDISSMMQPTTPVAVPPLPSPARGGSAPNSPTALLPKDAKDCTLPERSATDPNLQAYMLPEPPSDDVRDQRRDMVAAANAKDNDDVVPTPIASLTEPSSEEDQDNTTENTPQRTRVGFSDTLEFIPRPLSVISSDSASTVTARPYGRSGNHSVTGSISSIISLSTSIAASSDRDPLSPLAWSPSRSTTNESRPSTAGAILDRTQGITVQDSGNAAPTPWRRNSIPVLSTIPNVDAPLESPPVSAHSLPSKTPKRWSFFGRDPLFSGNGSSHSSPTRPSYASSPLSGGVFPALPGVDSAKAMHIASPPDKSLGQLAADAGSYEDVVDAGEALRLTKTVSRKPSSTKKKKKVKSWGILSRKKSKARRKSRRAPTPPPITIRMESDNDVPDAGHANDAHRTAPLADDLPSLEAGDFAAPPPIFVTPSGSPSASTWQPEPSPTSPAPTEDSSFAMIDLDAALGPFNTPLPRNAEWEASQLAGGLSKRQLHSAAGMTRFSGPGMHYSHRRAESAPEMPPFNRAGLARFGSSTTMADVFEEDEEEDEEAKNKAGSSSLSATGAKASCSASLQCTSKPSSLRSASSSSSMPYHWPADSAQEQASNIDIRVTSSDGGFSGATGSEYVDAYADYNSDATPSFAMSRRGSNVSGVSDDDRTQPSMCLKSEYSASSLHDDVIVEEEDSYLRTNGMDNGFGFDNDSCEFAMESSSDSTIIQSPGRLMKGKDLAPVDVSPMHLPTNSTSSLAAPVSPYSMAPSSASAFASSPRSPLSYDAARVSLTTAPSSITEDNFQSLLMGEPGPEVRISSDIPSLTSSNSTMTRESAAPHTSHMSLQGPPLMPQMPFAGPQPRPYLPSRDMERPASFTTTAFGRRRSSLASLHRLISTSHGERSKLSIEVPMDVNSTSPTSTSSVDHEKRKSTSRTKRLSRMMQFWRKEDD